MTFKFTKTAPDGSQMSEWEPVEFIPQQDITPYELAMIVKDYATPQPFTEGQYMRKDRSNLPNWSVYARHFKVMQ